MENTKLRGRLIFYAKLCTIDEETMGGDVGTLS